MKIDKDFNVQIEMTLTSPNCPVAESMPKEVEDKVAEIPKVKSAKVNIVFDPPWDKDMMSEEAKLELGFLIIPEYKPLLLLFNALPAAVLLKIFGFVSPNETTEIRDSSIPRLTRYFLIDSARFIAKVTLYSSSQ